MKSLPFFFYPQDECQFVDAVSVDMTRGKYNYLILKDIYRNRFIYYNKSVTERVASFWYRNIMFNLNEN